mmetsp:Transcript_53079/g.85907  ORF Transcript_53079/g.85907 Transcript_53079/m.85907 type:complete len:89 (+) Transcript_53079:816-1082(+)
MQRGKVCCNVLQYATVGAVCRKQFKTCGTALPFSCSFLFLAFSPHSAFNLYKQCVTLICTNKHTRKHTKIQNAGTVTHIEYAHTSYVT